MNFSTGGQHETETVCFIENACSGGRIGVLASFNPGGANAEWYNDRGLPVWRAQLLITTADATGGDTDSWVDAKLNFDNSTRLYSSFNNADDFERGRTHIYELVLDYVSKLRDIQMIQLSKPGSDSWCIQALTLIVNGRAVFDVDFAGNGYWMGANALLFIPYPSLRPPFRVVGNSVYLW